MLLSSGQADIHITLPITIFWSAPWLLLMTAVPFGATGGECPAGYYHGGSQLHDEWAASLV
jgi:hypothetical protein